MAEKHTILNGKMHVYQREGSPVGVHRNSPAFRFHGLRGIVAGEPEAGSAAMFGGGIEGGGGCFGGRPAR